MMSHAILVISDTEYEPAVPVVLAALKATHPEWFVFFLKPGMGNDAAYVQQFGRLLSKVDELVVLGGTRPVEFGIALGLGKPVVTVTPDLDYFPFHEIDGVVTNLWSPEEFIQALFEDAAGEGE